MVFFFRSRHRLRISLFTALLDELGLLSKDAGGEGIFLLQFTPVIPLAVIDRGIITNGIAGALFVVEFHISIKDTFDLIPGSAYVNLEVHEELFLNPAVQRLVDGIVCGLTGTGHGSDDVGILDQIVIGHRGVYAALICMNDRRLVATFQHFHDVCKAPEVLLSAAPPFCQTPTEDFLGKDIEVKGHLEIIDPEFQARHVGYNYLPGPVYRLPGREDQVWIFVSFLPWTAMFFVLRLCCNPKIAKTLVCVVVTDLNFVVGADKSGCPAVSMGFMFFVYSIDKGNHVLPVEIPFRRLTLFPFVIAGSAYSHQGA